MVIKRNSLFKLNLIGFIVLLSIAESQLSSLQHEPDLEWYTLFTDNFFIHVPSDYKDLGYKIGNICEEIYHPISRSLKYFPGKTHVVVHTRVDFPNGVVSFSPWRMELFISAPQGNILGLGDRWLRELITHEFTHIVQLRKRNGLSSLTYPFLGDYNSFWQQIVPSWFTEGFATLNETRFTTGGRGRNAYHWMQMMAPINERQPWELVNTSYTSRKRLPSNQMRYISGYYLSNFVNQRYGPDTWAKILDKYTAFPLLGFDRAVKNQTGKGLNQIYHEMLGEFEISGFEANNFASSLSEWRKLDILEDHHSPRWVDNDHIMVYRKSLDDLPELTIVDRDGKLHRIRQRKMAKLDNSFTVGKKGIVWSELHPHPRFSATIYSDLVLYNWNTDKKNQLTHNARIYNPDLSPNETKVIAIQTALPTNRIVSVNLTSRKITSILEIPNTTFLNPRWSPDGKWIAFAIKETSASQDIAILELETGRWKYVHPPDIYHDNNPSWTPDGQFILYTSDRSGIFNIWAVELVTGKRWMLTNSELGVFTPDVSPDGKELAFKHYTNCGFAIATILLDSSSWIPEEDVQYYYSPMIFPESESIRPRPDSVVLYTQDISSYRPWNQILRPQGWIPFIIQDEDGKGMGLFAFSQDALHRHIWYGNLGVSFKDFQSSMSFNYTYRHWWLIPEIKSYSLSEPVSNHEETGWKNVQGAELALSLPLTLENNVYLTFLQLYIRGRNQFGNYYSDNFSSKRAQYRGLLFGFDFDRTGQATRDLVPHRAWIIRMFNEQSIPKLGSDFESSQICNQMNLFFPTPIPHHQIELLAKYQFRKGNYQYLSYGAFPIGYNDNHRRHQLRIRIAYIFPLAYLELPLPLFPFYIDYLDATIFYDWGTDWETKFLANRIKKGAISSVGIQIKTVNYLFQIFTVNLGVTFYYRTTYKDRRMAPLINITSFFPFRNH